MTLKPLLLTLGCVLWLPNITACSHFRRQSACAAIADPDISLLKPGYFAVRSRCEYIYCHYGPKTGSQLSVRECSTAAELARNEKEAQDFMNKAKEPRPMVCNAEEGCRPL